MVRQSMTMLKAVFCAWVCASSTQAAMYGFTNITQNSAVSAAIGEEQLFVEVSNAGNGQVLFTFKNTGPELSSITDVYFDDAEGCGCRGNDHDYGGHHGFGKKWGHHHGHDNDHGDAGNDGNDEEGNCEGGPYLGGIAQIINMPGVQFSEGANPANLPGANNVSPPFEADFSADSDSPTQPKGVNPGEQLGIIFDLEHDVTYSDLIAALGSGAVRIGIKVQGFANGESEGFINNTTPVPAPSAGLLAFAGLSLVVWLRRRRLNDPKKGCSGGS